MRSICLDQFFRNSIATLYIFLLWFGYTHSIESSTHYPVNRGAARQMYGSGSLRHTGSGPLFSNSTSTPMYPKTVKDKYENKNKLQLDEKAVPESPDHGLNSHDDHTYDSHGSGGYGYGYSYGGFASRNSYQKPAQSQILPGYYGNSKIAVSSPADNLSSDIPSYRNGAPVNGARSSVNNAAGSIYGQGRIGIAHGLDWSRRRGSVYGSYGGAGHLFNDKTRVQNGLQRGHGVGQFGDPDGNLTPQQKSLIQELEDENDAKDPLALGCGWICGRDKFLCFNTCTCINLEDHCDGKVDCEGAEDELNCKDILDARNSNGDCYGERNISCPESKKCISKEWLCDGDDDCGDYSDESHCGPHKNCTEDQFECRNGLCILHTWLCDGENDCKDFSDEDNCSTDKKCHEDEFSCADGTCIKRSMKCNGEKECPDGSDELNCKMSELPCAEGDFECSYPRCISKDFFCDGENDCGDWSDEKDCQSIKGATCNPTEFRCSNGDCINGNLVCDRKVDCRGGDDELDCEFPSNSKNCTENEFTCRSGNCVPHNWVCDGVPDCSDGEDEDDCQVTCEATQYFCKQPLPLPTNETSVAGSTKKIIHEYQHCIATKHVCDGVPDCPLEDDEMNCPKKRVCGADDKCSQLCILTYDNKKACACEQGFTLAHDNFTCLDINECQFEKDPVCSQLCNNTVGSFACGCISGYILRPDLRTCKALGANPTLLFANRVDIRQVSLITVKYTSILKGLHNAVALDFHYKRETIYWSDVSLNVIRKIFINGSNAEDVIRWGLESPSGLAIDWIHNLLFWADSGTKRVEVITLDTKIRHVLISSDLDKPRAIAVHPHYGYVYWTDWGPNPKIERADMDGSGRVALITESIFWPNGLTIDYTSDRIYWTDAKHHAIESAHLDGTDRKKIISKGLHHPFAITVFEDSIYWTDWHFKSISSANKGTGRDFKTIHSRLHFPMDVHSYHPQRQPDYANHCRDNNGKCSHMCLPNSTGYSCVCPVGFKIKRDGKNCATTADNLLIFARKKDLRLMPLDQSTRTFDTVIPVDFVQNALALTWDSENDTIYWTDVKADTITRAHINGTNQISIIKNNLETPAGIALDWITKKLYWTDAGTKRIECSNLNGSMRMLLLHKELDKPRDIVLNPLSGYMYWSDWGKHAKIERAGMHGEGRQILIEGNLVWPNGLAIDFEKGRLYWADGSTKKIEYSDLAGAGRKALISTDLQHPFGLTVHKNKVYWTDWITLSIHRADKDTGGNRTVIRSGMSGLMDVRIFHHNRPMMDTRCNHNNGDCSHLCLLTPDARKYTCACPTGLILDHDGKTCPDAPKKFLIVTNQVDIRIISLDVPHPVDVVLPNENIKNVTGVDVNKRNGDIYWSDPWEDVIRKSTFDGKTTTTIIDSGISNASSLAIDSIGRKLYWTDAGLNSIEVSELDGKNRKVLIWSGLDSPRAVALHYAAGLLFWSDWGHNARIERANMDGEERTTVIAENLMWPDGLSIDVKGDKLYWSDAERKVIECSDLQGLRRKTLIENVEHSYGLAILDDFLYWTDWKSKALFQANKTFGNDRKVVVEKLENLMDIRAVAWKDIHEAEDVCGKNNGNCSHLCLRNPRGYSCACPTGILLNDDKRTCNATPTNFLLFARQKTLARMSFDTPEMWEVALPVANVHKALSVDFHWENRLIIYSDVNQRVIRTIDMNNFNETKTIVHGFNGSSPFRIAVDWIANNIYWTDKKNRMIEVARLDGSCRKKLIVDLKEPRSIALFPREGYMFWTEWDGNVRIERATLDGMKRKAIISTDLTFPNGLTIDYETKKLYWADALKNRIEMSDLHGRYRIQLVPEAVNPLGLTQYGDYIYWADWQKEIVERADKTTGKNRIEIRTALGGLTETKAVSANRQTGWTPCAIQNGGCTHLCFYVRRSYKCACPDEEDTVPCSTVPQKRVPLRKPGTENDPTYDELEDDDKLLDVMANPNHDNDDEKFKDFKFNRGKSYSLKTVVITILIMVTITFVIVIMIIYLLCQRKTKQKKYLYAGRRNVLTFSNPNYNASGADVTPSNCQQDRKTFIWKRLKYDRSQERVYEDNGQASSPEVVSLIPPSATTSSSGAPSVTPRESSPPLTHVTHLNG